MRKTLLYIIMVFASLGIGVGAAGQTGGEEEINFYNPSNWLLGYFQEEQLRKPPHDAWFLPQYNNYVPNEVYVHEITALDLNEVTVLIVSGTWCPDTRREVPRFLNVIDQCGLQRIKVKHLGVDLNKVAPVGDYEQLNIERVPTFIVYRENVEIGRIVEYPKTSLEWDLLEILRK
jgi:hypothetical protein